MNAFWIVWNELSGASTVKHSTEQSARQEAERLARSNAGQTFHVLMSIASCRKVDVEWRDYYGEVQYFPEEGK
jgi:hypothetical protein